MAVPFLPFQLIAESAGSAKTGPAKGMTGSSQGNFEGNCVHPPQQIMSDVREFELIEPDVCSCLVFDRATRVSS